MADAKLVGKAGGFFLSIVGSMVLGISVGLGVAGSFVRARLMCTPLAGESNACIDILSTVNDMIVAASIGGVLVLGTGLLALWMVYQEGE